MIMNHSSRLRTNLTKLSKNLALSEDIAKNNVGIAQLFDRLTNSCKSKIMGFVQLDPKKTILSTLEDGNK